MNVKISAFNQGKLNLENQFCIFGRKRKCNDDIDYYTHIKRIQIQYIKKRLPAFLYDENTIEILKV